MLLLIVLIPICVIGPGFAVLGRVRLDPLERLCASVAVSFVILYAASFAWYLSGAGRLWCWALPIVSATLVVARRRSVARLLADRRVRGILGWMGALTLWTLLCLAVIRSYSGGGWGGDWAEHYHRTLFFLRRLPTSTVIFGGYQVPARPPFANLLAATFLAMAGEGFEVFQIVFTSLSVFVFLPGCLLLRLGGRGSSRCVAVLACLLATNPFFIENSTYTWTKLLAAFFVLTALWFYLAGHRKRDPVRTVLAFAFLSAGVLVHYSVLPYAVVVTAHFVVSAPRTGRTGLRHAVLAAGVAGAILATWFGWSAATYGVRVTVASNTAVSATSGLTPAADIAKIALNLVDTIVPHPARGISLDYFRQASRPGMLRDWAFLVYQTNAIVAIGSIGGPVAAAALVWLAAAGGAGPGRAQRRLFLAATAASALLAVAVHGERDAFGVTHVVLQPVVLLGLVFLAAVFPRLPRPVRLLVAGGAALDCAVGVLLQLWAEGGTAARLAGGQILARDPLGATLSATASLNWAVKAQNHLTFLGDHWPGLAVPLFVLLAFGALAAVGVLTAGALGREV